MPYSKKLSYRNYRSKNNVKKKSKKLNNKLSIKGGGGQEEIIKSNIDAYMNDSDDLESLSSDDNNFDKFKDLQKFEEKLMGRLRFIEDERNRDEEVCERNRKALDNVCPHSETYPDHKNKDIEYHINSCKEAYNKISDDPIITIEDIKKIRKMKEYYRICGAIRTVELELECGETFYRWNEAQVEGHRVARTKMNDYRDECNECIRKLKDKLNNLNKGRELKKNMNIDIEIAEKKFKERLNTEDMNEYLKKYQGDAQFYRAARYVDMTQEDSVILLQQKENLLLKQKEEHEAAYKKRQEDLKNVRKELDAKEKQRKHNAQQQQAKEQRQQKLEEEEYLKKVVEMRLNLPAFLEKTIDKKKEKVNKMTKDDKDILKEILKEELNDYSKLIIELELENLPKNKKTKKKKK